MSYLFTAVRVADVFGWIWTGCLTFVFMCFVDKLVLVYLGCLALNLNGLVISLAN